MAHELSINDRISVQKAVKENALMRVLQTGFRTLSSEKMAMLADSIEKASMRFAKAIENVADEMLETVFAEIETETAIAEWEDEALNRTRVRIRQAA